MCPEISKMADCYEIMGVQRTATYDDIRRVYLELAKKFHPDRKVATSSKDAFQKVSQAYTTLSCPVRRAEHDRYLGLTETGVAHGGHHGQCTIRRENKFSLTMDVSEGLFQMWLDTTKEYYPDAEVIDRDQQGVQVRTAYTSPDNTEVMGTISITFYKTTSRIHVQGSSYILWMEEHLEILEKLVGDSVSQDEELRKIQGPPPRKSHRPRRTGVGASGGVCGVCKVSIDGDAWACDMCLEQFHTCCTQEDGEGDTVCPLCTQCTPSALIHQLVHPTNTEPASELNQHDTTPPTDGDQQAKEDNRSNVLGVVVAQPAARSDLLTAQLETTNEVDGPTTDNAPEHELDEDGSGDAGPTAGADKLGQGEEIADTNSDTGGDQPKQADTTTASGGGTRKQPACGSSKASGKKLPASAKQSAAQRRKMGSRQKCTEQSLVGRVSVLTLSVGHLKKSLQKLENKYTDLVDRTYETAEKAGPQETIEQSKEPPKTPPAAVAPQGNGALVKRVAQLEKQVLELQHATPKTPAASTARDTKGTPQADKPDKPTEARSEGAHADTCRP